MNWKAGNRTAISVNAILRVWMCVIAISIAGSASANSDWLDVPIVMAVELAPVTAVSDGRGYWVRAPVRMLIGLEKMSNVRCREGDHENCSLLDSYRMVIDMTAAARNAPSGCGQKLAAPWRDLRKSFRPKQGFWPSMWSPERQVRRDGWPFQELGWRQGECEIKARFSWPVDPRVNAKSQLPASMKGLNGNWFPGGYFQEISLTLASKGQRADYVMGIPFRQVPSNSE